MLNNKFILRARKFINKYKLKGPSGFIKYVILNYIEAVNKVTDDFIFKGGNLVWYYIKTPRATIDLDLCTISLNSSDEIKNILNKASSLIDGIVYSLENYKEVKVKDKIGAIAVIKYKTEDGASNQFQIDIVYKLETEINKINLELNDTSKNILAATIESIIIDKIDASHKFKSGNTRIKDYDDLYRFAISNLDYDIKKIRFFLKNNKFNKVLDENWITEAIKKSWALHAKRYTDLPSSLNELFKTVNEKFLNK